MKQPFRLDGRTAFITGGASGIGESICRVFHAAGAAVVVADIDPEGAGALAAELPGARAVVCDVTREESVAAAMATLDGLDILVNNAGIGFVGNVEETPLEEFERLFRVNVTGAYLTSRAALSLLLRSGGCIINMGSVAGMVGVKRRFAYCATKGAVIAMTRQMAVDYPVGLRVNCICPGTVDTPFVEGFLERFHKHEKEKMREELNRRQPVGRLGRPDEVAYLALYLASDEAGFVNGAAMAIDGGWTAA